MRFRDIPQMSRPGYSCHCDLTMLQYHLDRYVSSYQLDMNPDFQRGHVWSPPQRISYVEFILRGGNSSKDIYFNCPGWMNKFGKKMVLVDGKQRLSACLDFMNGIIPVFDGHHVEDFQDRPMNINLCLHINSLSTRKEVLQWYLDINAGGIAHTTDEIDKVRRLLVKEKDDR